MARKGVKTKVGQDKDAIVAAVPLACGDETAAVEFFEQRRWKGTPCCVDCGSVDVYQMKDAKTGERNRRYLWRCHDCKRQFTVRIGTVLEDSRIPLRHWCYAFWRASTSKKGVSALEIKRQTGLSYKSALFLMHRIRWAMAPSQDCSKLNGTVEADETFIGGKPRHRIAHKPRKRPNDPPNNTSTRKARHVPVFAAVERDGRVCTRVIADVKAATLKMALNELICKSARLITDEAAGYMKPGREYAQHDKIRHKNHEYVRGDVTTNTVEGFLLC